MDWIRKHIQNKDDTGVVLADDFRVISIALGQNQKELLVDWMTKFVHDFKRGVLS